MFNKLKEKFGKPHANTIVIGAPVSGEAVPISDVSDATFAQEILGKGVAIKPSEGRIVSPVDGTVQTIFETGHAVSVVSDSGVEILIHVGLDTVKLKGQYFTKHTQSNAKVKKGDLLIEFDLSSIHSAGYDVITPVIICNSDAFTTFRATTGRTVQALDTLLELEA